MSFLDKAIGVPVAVITVAATVFAIISTPEILVGVAIIFGALYYFTKRSKR